MSTPLTVRTPRADDWAQIGRLADAAVEHLEDAQTQQEWLQNRRNFSGWRRHWVALRAGEIAGYGALEHPGPDPAGGAVRLFVVTVWGGLLEAAEVLYDLELRELRAVGAESAWMREYASDRPLLDFFEQRGFTIGELYDSSGTSLVNLTKPIVSEAAVSKG